MTVRRLNHAVLYVNGLRRTVDFYTQVLGLELRAEIPGVGAFLRSPESVNDHDLGVFEVGTGHASGKPEVGLYHLAWEVPSIDDLVTARRELTEMGALVGSSDHGVSKSLYAKDPDGNEFEVMWAVPVDQRPSDVYTRPLDLDAEVARFARS